MPYERNQKRKERFQCDQNLHETIHLRLDKERGFETQRNHDFLTVSWSGYEACLHGTIEDIPKLFRQFDWYNTESHYLIMKFESDSSTQMEFESDSSIQLGGFQFEIICRPNAHFGCRPNTHYDCGPNGLYVKRHGHAHFDDLRKKKNDFITNDQKRGEVFSKWVNCLTPSENIHYRPKVQNTLRL